MKDDTMKICDANEATASVAYRASGVIAIYPITPSSPMAESCDEWASAGKKNLWGFTPDVAQLQSEGGVAGAVHGALQGGAMVTTFTASQGLLLMIPNMYKIAGELTPFCMHVTARSLATHALSIFGDHSDVMACRQTGFAMLCSNSVQEAHDLACIAHAATLQSRVPFMHFFDGFRTSHEINTFSTLSDDVLRKMISEELVFAHRDRALTPDHPLIRGTAQNPDVFFQCREAGNAFYDKVPAIVDAAMRQFEQLTGRAYHIFDYEGHPEAEHVIVIMGSGAETCAETAAWLNQKGAKTGVLKVRLFRPFSVDAFVKALPKTVKKIAVLDRTKESGAIGEPLYQDVLSAFAEARASGVIQNIPAIVGGRYGLGSKEFTPTMVKRVFDELTQSAPKNHFTIGINDDVTHTSLNVTENLDLEAKEMFRAVFVGLGADGTVGANKNSIKIIGDETDNYAQAYFVYDSKKSGAMTVSHLRFGPKPIRAPYLIQNAHFVGCHQPQFLEKYDILSYAAQNAVFLLNSHHDAAHIWDTLPIEVQESIIKKQLKFYAIDAYKVAQETEMGTRINTIMQTCFFAISGVLPRDEAIAQIKKSIEKTYRRKGDAVIQKNFAAVDTTLANLNEIKYPANVTSKHHRQAVVPSEAPAFIQNVTAKMMENRGDELPVSKFPIDGTWPTGTTKWEKRSVAQEVPVWDPSICIQCNRCSMVCPHACIRTKCYPTDTLNGAPEGFQSTDYKGKDFPNHKFTVQVSPEDCTGCQLCVMACPAKDKSNPKHKAINMVAIETVKEKESANFKFFESLPWPDRSKLGVDLKSTQLRQPLFEFSGACAGCGETPYIKLLSQLYGDRLVIANATGCSSIYGGNLPTTPYTTNKDGRGPAWANSLFEDNAEFGFGLRLAVDKRTNAARELLKQHAGILGDTLVQETLNCDQSNEAGVEAQRKRVELIRAKVDGKVGDPAHLLNNLADYLVEKVVWIIGGDGWAYDIGYGGLDHVLASQRNINVIVLDTEVYSNTGGQQSKSTPIGAIAKFAASGKATPKKDLGLLAMGYGNVYVAQVAMGAKPQQTVQAIVEAQQYRGSSLVIAYSHCIAHGYNLSSGLDQQTLAVNSGCWPLYRYDPRRHDTDAQVLKLDSDAPSVSLSDYIRNEARYRSLELQDPERAKQLVEMAQKRVIERYKFYAHMAGVEAKEVKFS